MVVGGRVDCESAWGFVGDARARCEEWRCTESDSAKNDQRDQENAYSLSV